MRPTWEKSCVGLFALPKNMKGSEAMTVAILEEYKGHLTQDGKRPKTIESYAGDVKGLLKYLQEMGVAFEGVLSRFFITSYKNHLLEENYEATTR